MWKVKVKSIKCKRWKWKGSNVKNEKLIMKSIKCEGKTFQRIRGLSASHLMAVKSDRAFISSLQCHRPFISIGKNVQDFQTNVWRKSKRRQSFGEFGRQILFGGKPKWKQADEDAKSKYSSGGWIWALTVDIMAATPNI